MGALKKETLRGNMNGKKSTFNVELVEVSGGFEVNYSDAKGWGVGYKNFQKCDNLFEATEAYASLKMLMQV